MAMQRALRFALLGALATAAPGFAADFADCERQLAAAPDSEAAANCFYDAGQEHNAFPEAARRLEQRLAEQPGNPWLRLNLGHARWRDAPAAELLYRQAAGGFAARGERRGEILARVSLHQVLISLGRADEAGSQVERVARLAGAITGSSKAAQALRARAQVLLAKHLMNIAGDLERAYRALQAARGPVQASGNDSLQRDWLLTLANVCKRTGRDPEAKRYYQQFARLADGKGDRFAAAVARYDLAFFLAERLAELPRPEDLPAVLAAGREALAAAQASGHQSVEVKASWLLGLLTPPDEAAAHLDRCQAAAATDEEKSWCLNARVRRLAGTRAAEGDPAQAWRRAEESLALARGRWSRAYAAREKMRAGWALPAVPALDDSLAAVDAIEAIREPQRGSPSEAGLFASWVDDFHWLSGRLLLAAADPAATPGERSDRLAQAFGIGERGRAQALIEILESQGTPATPEAYALAEPAALATLAKVQQALAADEALVSFQIAPWRDAIGDFAGGAWAWTVTRDAVRVQRLEWGRVELRPAVALWLSLFPRRDGSEAAASRTLDRILLAGPLSRIPPGIRKLILVPDDQLHRLPFAALRPATRAAPRLARLQVSIVPSASLWLRWRNQPPTSFLIPVLALAAPRVPSRPAAEDARPPYRIGRAGTSPSLAALPWSRREGRSAVRRLGRGSLLRTGAAASEAYLKAAPLRRFGILHFATHAWVDEENPEQSAVPLAAGDDTEDGLLHGSEIAALPLEGKAVVLSSCDSAAGAVLRGEGVMGLARSFFQAGTRTVVGSLWPVRDDEAAEFFDRFYRHLARGRSVAVALRATQAELRGAGRPAVAWAGFVALGDGGAVPLPGGLSWFERYRYPLLGAAGLALAALALGLRRRLTAA